MGRALIALSFSGLFVGGFRSQAAWTCAAALLWLAALDGRLALSRRALTAWAPWLCWLLVSAALCSQPLKCLPALARWSSLAVFFALARLAWGERERRWWLAALWACAPLLGAAGLATGARGLRHGGLGGDMTGFLPPYYNYTVFVEAAALASLLAALLHGRDLVVGRRRLAWACAAWLAALILLSRSRGGMVAVALGLAVVGARRGGLRRLWKPAAGLVLIAVAATAFGVSRGQSPVFLLKLDKASVFKRPEIWRAAVSIAADHPLAGEGPGNFEAGFLRHNFPAHFRLADYLYTTEYAHSELFQALAETGPLGLILMLLAFARSLAPPDSARTDGAREAALAAVAAMGAMCVFDNMLQIPALGMLLLGGIAACSGKRAEVPLAPNARRALAGAGLLLALGAWMPAAFAASARARAADEFDGEKRLSLLRVAESIYPEDADIKHDVAQAYSFTSPPCPDLALSALQEASRLSPTNAVFLLERAELLESTGRLDESAELAGRAAALEPNCLEARLMLAARDARRGDRGSALGRLAEVSRLRARIEPHMRDWGGAGYARRVCAFDSRRFAVVAKMLESRRP